MVNKLFLIVMVLLTGFSCNPNRQNRVSVEIQNIAVPLFNADSAYQYTSNQVAFGPRVPNTNAHKQCGNYLADELKRFGATVIEQKVVLYTYNNIALNAKNIIGSFQPENKNRILLAAHWDSRPFADQDANPVNHRTPVDGANDGAGACGVLLEIARQIALQQPAIGVDIIFFDAEDWGAPEFDDNLGGWCLGSEYWAQHPHDRNYKARYGIVLDMVSAYKAVFCKERYSLYYAGNIVKKVWEAAQIEGYGSYFVNQEGNPIQDDHIAVNQYLKIPCIDIIQYDPDTPTGFGYYWHTLNDNMDAVSKETQKAVGQTLLYVLYNEK
jgi:Zn-dependent M28 family amino/carboxypeptidase